MNKSMVTFLSFFLFLSFSFPSMGISEEMKKVFVPYFKIECESLQNLRDTITKSAQNQISRVEGFVAPDMTEIKTILGEAYEATSDRQVKKNAKKIDASYIVSGKISEKKSECVIEVRLFDCNKKKWINEAKTKTEFNLGKILTVDLNSVLTNLLQTTKPDKG